MKKSRIFPFLGLALALSACQPGQIPPEWAAAIAGTATALAAGSTAGREHFPVTPEWVGTPFAFTEFPLATPSTPMPRFGMTPAGTPMPTTAPCSLAPPIVSSDLEAGVQVFAAPSPVTPGGRLTYCITFDAAVHEITPTLLFHLPNGAQFVRADGAGWQCTASPDRPGELSCLNALGSRIAPSLLIETIAPSTAGQIQACVEVTKLPSQPWICVISESR